MPFAAAAAIGAVGTVAGAAIQASSKPGTGSASQQSRSDPWDAQQPYLLAAWNEAQNAEQERLARGPYAGSYFAPMTQAGHLSAEQGQRLSYALNDAGSSAIAAGQSETRYAPSYAGNANYGATAAGLTPDASARYALGDYGAGGNPFWQTPSADPAGQLHASLNSAAIAGANSLQGYANGTQSVMQAAMRDPTQQLAANAGTYARAGYVDQAVASANDSIDRTLHETTVPGLNRQAALGGSLNSSRAGMAEAMANRDAASLKAQSEATIRGNAFNAGLSTAAGQRTAGLSTGLAAANAGYGQAAGLSQGVGALDQSADQFNVTSRLGAAQAALSSDLGYGSLNANTRLAYNAQLGQAVGQGYGALATGGQLGALGYQVGSAGAASEQANNQGALDDAFKAWQMQDGWHNQVASDYSKIVGGQNWGSTQTGSQQTTGASNIGQTIGALGNFAGAQFSRGGQLYDLINESNTSGFYPDNSRPNTYYSPNAGLSASTGGLY